MVLLSLARRTSGGTALGDGRTAGFTTLIHTLLEDTVVLRGLGLGLGSRVLLGLETEALALLCFVGVCVYVCVCVCVYV